MTEPCRILVVEDQGIIAWSLAAKLKRLGYDLAGIASSGLEAIDKAEETHPHLVLMDIILKGDMDGVEAGEVIRSRLGVPVVYLTAHSDAMTVNRAMKTVPYGYILKPCEENQLSYVIYMALNAHQLQKMAVHREQLLVSVLDRISEAVIAIDDHDLIICFNRAAEVITGREQENAVGKEWGSVFELAYTGDPDGHPLHGPLQKGLDVVFEDCKLLVLPNGPEVRVNGSTAAMKDNKGNVSGAVLVCRPVVVLPPDVNVSMA